MDDVNTYKVNSLLQNISDADLVTELIHRGFEVTKWEAEDLEYWDLDVWNDTDVWNE